MGERTDDAGAHRKGEAGVASSAKPMAKAVKRPVAWNPPAGAKLSRNQIFNYRRRAVEHYAHYLGFDLRLDSELLWLAEEGLYAPVPEVRRKHTAMQVHTLISS